MALSLLFYYEERIMQNVLITGGFGYVGTALLPYIKKYNVRVIDNLMSGMKPTHEVDFIYGDIRTVSRKHIEWADTIVHLAAIVGEPAVQVHLGLAYDINVYGTLRIVDMMRSHQKMIFTSTSSVYGNRPGETVTEETVPLPINAYGRHKYAAELLVRQLPNHVIFRPVTAFGTTLRTRLDVLVNTLIYEALTTGSIKVFETQLIRPIIYVQDFARLLAHAVHGYIDTGIYNIGDPQLTMTKGQLAEHIASLCNVPVFHSTDISLDQRDYNTSFDKIQATGYTFQHNSLKLAIEELKALLPLDNPERYYAPYQVQQFIAKESYVHRA